MSIKVLHKPIRKTFDIFDVLFLSAVKILLEIIYVNFVSSYFEYEGYYYNFKLSLYIFGWFVFLFGISIFYIKSNLRIIDFYLLMFILWFLPNLIFFVFSSQNLIHFFSIIIPFFLIILLTFNKEIIKVKSSKYGKSSILIISFLVSLIVLIHFMVVSGGALNFDFTKVYDQREMYGEEFESGIFGYLNNWTFKIFSIIILAWAISKKKFFSIFFSIALIILQFGFSGHKSSLTGLFLVPFFYVMYKQKDSKKLIIIGFIFLLVFNLLLARSEDNMLWVSILIRRMFFTPANLNNVYFEFFDNNPFYYWSNSSFQVFNLNLNYDISLSFVIGRYLGDYTLGANTGFIASGYAQAGLVGIILYTTIVIFLMNVINTIAKRRELYIVMSLLIMPLSVLYTSSDLPTSFITHGVLLGTLLLYFYDNRGISLVLGQIKIKI